MERGIQIAVARADMILCHIAALPWGWIALAVLAVYMVRRAVRKHE